MFQLRNNNMASPNEVHQKTDEVHHRNNNMASPNEVHQKIIL